MNFSETRNNELFNQIIDLIERARSRAFYDVNEELILLYYKVGKIVAERVEKGEWGENTVEALANHINFKYPELKGFNRRGLYRMKSFYVTYSNPSFVSILLTQMKGKLNFYSDALYRDVKKSHEKESIGILLRKGKDSELVKYAMYRNSSPALVADYETKLIPKNILELKLQ